MNYQDVDGLDPKQEEALIELLNQPTIRKASEALQITERTLYRWLEQPVFRDRYRKMRREAFKQAVSLTQRYAPLAIQTLAKVMTDEKTSAAAKVSAAEAILKFSRDSIELDDLEGRLEVLENQARSPGGLPPQAPTPSPSPTPPTLVDGESGEERRAA